MKKRFKYWFVRNRYILFRLENCLSFEISEDYELGEVLILGPNLERYKYVGNNWYIKVKS